MSKKLTYEYVKEQIEKEGYELLSETYKNCGLGLKTRCPKGHEWIVSWNGFQQGHRCLVCSYIERGKKKKFTYDYVKEYIESFGYILLSGNYKNAFVKLKIKCPKGHKFSMKFSNFKSQGQRCPECFGTPKYTYEFVKEHIESFGYKLLSKEYINNKGRLKVKCPNGHITKIQFANFKNLKSRCNICAGHEKHSYDYIKEQFEEEGYVLLSKKYKNNKTILKTRCPKGHIHNIPYNRFRAGDRCPICKDTTLTIEYVKERVEKEGYRLLSNKYKNYETPLVIKCPMGHIWESTWGRFKRGSRCPICWFESISSKPETEILEYIKIIYNNTIVPNDRTQIINPETGCNLELDIWLPESKKAIEFNGIYWHSLYATKKRDKIKKRLCVEKKIDLMVIHEQEWIANKEKCLNKIKEFVNVESNKEVKES